MRQFFHWNIVWDRNILAIQEGFSPSQLTFTSCILVKSLAIQCKHCWHCRLIKVNWWLIDTLKCQFPLINRCWSYHPWRCRLTIDQLQLTSINHRSTAVNLKCWQWKYLQNNWNLFINFFLEHMDNHWKRLVLNEHNCYQKKTKKNIVEYIDKTQKWQEMNC